MSTGSSLFSYPVPGVITAAAVYSRGTSVLFFGTNTGVLYRCNLTSAPQNFQRIDLPVGLGLVGYQIGGIAVNGQSLYVSFFADYPLIGKLIRIKLSLNTPLFSYSGKDQSTIVVVNGAANITPADVNPTGGVAVTSDDMIYISSNSSSVVSIRGSEVNILFSAGEDTLYFSLALDPTEHLLYASSQYDRTLYSYNIVDNAKGLIEVVSIGQYLVTGVVVGKNPDIVFFIRTDSVPAPYPSVLHGIPLTGAVRDVNVAGGGLLSNGDPLGLRISGAIYTDSYGLALDPKTGFIYISSFDDPDSKIYEIRLSVPIRPLPTAAPPKQRSLACGLAEFGTCKRVTVPFSPREYWGWGSPNRRYFTPDPNVGCVPSHVFVGDHPCPEVRQPFSPPPPVPPPAPVVVIPPSTDVATTDFNSRSYNYLTTDIVGLTLVNTYVTGSTTSPSAPALGNYGQIYMVTSNGNIYNLAAGLSNTTGEPTSTSPAVSVTTGNIAVTSDSKLTIFDSSLNYIWSSNIAGGLSPAFGGGANGNVVFVASGSNVYALDAATRSNVWTHTFAEGEISSMPPSSQSGILLLGTSIGNVYSLDQTTGDIVWVYNTGLNSPIYTSANYTWDDRVVFAASNVIFNIDYDRTPPYYRTRTFTSLSGNIGGSFATAFDDSGNMWTYYTASNALFGVCMLDDSGNYNAWSSASIDPDIMTPGLTPTMDSTYAYVTSLGGRVMRYLAVPSGLVRNTIVQKSYVDSYLIPTTTITSPYTITNASNQLVVFDSAARAYIFQ